MAKAQDVWREGKELLLSRSGRISWTLCLSISVTAPLSTRAPPVAVTIRGISLRRTSVLSAGAAVAWKAPTATSTKAKAILLSIFVVVERAVDIGEQTRAYR